MGNDNRQNANNISKTGRWMDGHGQYFCFNTRGGVVKNTKKISFCRTKPSMIRAEFIPSKMLIWDIYLNNIRLI